MYCYTPKGFEGMRILIDICPYWEYNHHYGVQRNGYCAYMEKGDWEFDHYSLLWDQVKECGINDDWDIEDDNFGG